MVQKHDNSQQTSNASNATLGTQQPQPQQTSNGGFLPPRQPNRSLGNQTFNGGSDVKLSVLTENLGKMFNAVSNSPFQNVKVLLVDKHKTGYEESFIVVTHQENGKVYVVTLFSDRTLRKTVKEVVDINTPKLEFFPSRGVPMGNMVEYQVPTVPSDIRFDVEFRAVVRNELNVGLGLKIEDDAEILRSGSITIPSTLDLEKEDALNEIVFWCTSELQTAISTFDGNYFNFIPVSSTNPQTPQLSKSPINVYIQPNEFNTHEDMLSLPIYSPVRMELSQQTLQNNGGLRDESGELGTLMGYVDASYLDSETQHIKLQTAIEASRLNPANLDLAKEAMLAQTRKYRHTLVITKLDRRAGAYSPQDLLFNLTAIPTIGENNFINEAWCLPDSMANRTPFLDIGAFGYETALTGKTMKDGNGNEVGVKERVNTGDTTFDRTAQKEVIERIFYPEIAPAIDVLQSGPCQLFNSLFSPNESDCQVLMQAAIDLTNGRILDYFNDYENIIYKDMRGVSPWGIYTDKDGQVHDIREIFNYLGWLNFNTMSKSGKPNLEQAEKEMMRWSFAVEDCAGAPEYTRYMEKLAMMNEITNGTFKQLDKMERRYINPEFIKALRTALEVGGVRYINTSNQQTHNIRTSRGMAFLPHTIASMSTNTITQNSTGWTPGTHGQFGHVNRQSFL